MLYRHSWTKPITRHRTLPSNVDARRPRVGWLDPESISRGHQTVTSKKDGASERCRWPRLGARTKGRIRRLDSVLIFNAEKTENAIEVLLISEFDAQFALALSDRDVDLRVETIAQSFRNSEELGRHLRCCT